MGNSAYTVKSALDRDIHVNYLGEIKQASLNPSAANKPPPLRPFSRVVKWFRNRNAPRTVSTIGGASDADESQNPKNVEGYDLKNVMLGIIIATLAILVALSTQAAVSYTFDILLPLAVYKALGLYLQMFIYISLFMFFAVLFV